MLRVRFSDRFVAERTWVVDVLLREMLGLVFTVEIEPGLDGYLLELPNGRRLRIRDAFFGGLPDDTGYIAPRSVPERVTLAPGLPFMPEPDAVVLFGDPGIVEEQGELTCGVDIVATAFFMLSRWEEAVDDGGLDEHGRWPATRSLAFRHSFLGRPIVNEYAEALWAMLTHLGLEQARRSRRFAIVPTHDIDVIYYDRLRTLGYAGLRARSGSALVRATRGLLSSTNPYDTFSWLMDLSESVGVRSRFNLIGGGSSRLYDQGRYGLDDPPLHAIVRRILDRGHRLGFHPSYSSHLDAVQWSAERRAIEATFGVTLTEGRQHYLRFRVPDTWRIWDDAGMELDSTAGYADAEGFRCGTGDAFPVFDVRRRRALRLRELPLILMEGTLASYRRLSAAASLDVFRRYLDLAVRYRMPLTILFHNNSFDEVRWPGWRSTYEGIFDHIRRGTAPS